MTISKFLGQILTVARHAPTYLKVIIPT